MTQHKKWVFTELVKDPNDPMQLIAYAMYKADKDDHANQCRNRQMSELQITAELESYHDGIAHSRRKLNDYQDKARRMIDEVIQSVNDGVVYHYSKKIDELTTAHNKEKHALVQAHQKEIKKTWKDWTARAEKFTAHLKQDPWYWHIPKVFLKWVVSGIPGLLATVFTTVLIVGVVSIFTTNSIDTTKKALFKGIDTLLPGEHGVDLPSVGEQKPDAEKPKATP